MSDQEVNAIWYARPPEKWAAEPAWMSVSTLLAIEACPRRWSLSSAHYPHIWEHSGYPSKPLSAALIGQLLHSSLEIITKALNHAGCPSIHNQLFVSVLQELGGYTKIIEAQLDRLATKLNNNPRAKLNAEHLITKLRMQIPELRGRLQMFVSKLKLQDKAHSYPRKNKGTLFRRAILSVGSYAEVELRAESLCWRGFIDFLNLGEDECEIVDFKTGIAKPEHEFQARVYNLLWARDVTLNPKGLPVSKLALLYFNSEVVISPLTVAELGDLERDIGVRTHTALNNIRQDSPPAYPSVQNCSICPVRHLCDAYWNSAVQKQLKVQRLEDTATHSQSKFIDLEIILTQRESLKDWHGRVIFSDELAYHALVYIQFSNNILPMLEEFEVGTHLRLMAVYFTLPLEEASLLPTVVTMSRISEVFIIG